MREVLRTQLSFLLFRPIKPDLARRAPEYIVYVLLVTWAVGVGRYWDHPAALPWQYVGLGSVAYLFVLSTFLYLIIWPLQPERWNWLNVFLFVGLTSLPGALYSIPVERFMNLDLAQGTNAVFLGVVALWRVALYVDFLDRYARLDKFAMLIALVLPLSVIVFSLAILNLEHVVFNIMAGNNEADASSNDLAYMIVIFLTMFAYLSAPITLILYPIGIVRAWRRKSDSTESEDSLKASVAEIK